MQDDLKKLQGKIIQAAKRKDETLRRQFMHAQAQAFPAGSRRNGRSASWLLPQQVPARRLIDRLSEELPLDHGSHWVVTI